jgi:alpha-L-fucosidase
MLVNTVSCGGNLLMNVGPSGRGTFDDRALKALGVYRDWMKVNGRSIYGCTMSEYTAPEDCRYTQTGSVPQGCFAKRSQQDGNRLYLHIFAWPFRHIHLPGLKGKVEYAQLLHDASEIKFARFHEWEHRDVESDTLTLELPVRKPDIVVPVIELFLK